MSEVETTVPIDITRHGELKWSGVDWIGLDRNLNLKRGRLPYLFDSLRGNLRIFDHACVFQRSSDHVMGSNMTMLIRMDTSWVAMREVLNSFLRDIDPGPSSLIPSSVIIPCFVRFSGSNRPYV